MQIRIATDADQPTWDSYVLAHPEGLAYHQYSWKIAVERAYGFQGLYLLAERAGVICGVLPLIYMNPPLLGGRLVSLPYCDVGGCLASDAEACEALLSKSLVLAGQCKVNKLELRSIQTPGLNPLDNHLAGEKVRMVLDLPADSQTLLASLKSKLRSQVKKPERDGLSVRLGGVELVPCFYRVFSENMRNLGSPVHSRKWIESVVKAFAERARVGVVYTPGGIPAAAGIILTHSRTVSIPWASSSRAYNHLNPNMLLYWTFLAFAADGGHTRFDFGRSTPGEGTYRFKEQWGAKPLPLFWQDLIAGKNKKQSCFVTGFARRTAELIWARLPIRVATRFGPSLRRNISL